MDELELWCADDDWYKEMYEQYKYFRWDCNCSHWEAQYKLLEYAQEEYGNICIDLWWNIIKHYEKYYYDFQQAELNKSCIRANKDFKGIE